MTTKHLLGLVLISALLLGSISDATAAEAAIERRGRDEPDRRTITVSGEAETSAAPDRAIVRLGTSAQAEEAATAQSQVNDTMQKALAAIEKVGVARRAIRTTGLTLTPIYAPEKTTRPIEPRVVAYRAGNMIEVTIDDLKLVGKVIDAGISAGANQLQGITFELQNDLPQRTRALALATEEAQVKARAIADALNVRLIGVVDVHEGGVHIMPQREFFGAKAMAADRMHTPVEPGEVKLHGSVTIRYEISSPAGAR